MQYNPFRPAPQNIEILEHKLTEADVRHLEPLLDEGLPLVYEWINKSGQTGMPKNWTSREHYIVPKDTKTFIGKLRVGLNLAVMEDGECIDFDTKNDPEQRCYTDFMMDLQAVYPELAKKLIIQQTRSGTGRHLIYRCPVRSKTLALAYRKGEKRPMIETKGIGNQVYIFPSHNYKILQGDLSRIPEITPAERDVLFSIARSLNDENITKEQTNAKRRYKSNGTRPRDIFNSKVSETQIGELLESFSLSPVETNDKGTRLLREGSDNPSSGILFFASDTSPRITYLFTPGCISEDGKALPAEKGLSPFELFCYKQYGNADKSSISKAETLLEAQGFGKIPDLTPQEETLEWLDDYVARTGAYVDLSQLEVFNQEGEIFPNDQTDRLYIEMLRDGLAKASIRVIKSFWPATLPQRNSMKEFFESLPPSTNELNQLTDCVVFNVEEENDREMLKRLFRKCLISTVGTAMDDNFSGVLLPVLQGAKNCGKTTFVEFLCGLPTIKGTNGDPILSKWFLANFDLEAQNKRIRDRDLCTNFIAGYDDKDNYFKGGKAASALRSLVSQKTMSIQQLYKDAPKKRPRTATIWMTTNHTEVIHDKENNRRLIPMPVLWFWGAPEPPKELGDPPGLELKDINMRKVWREALDLYSEDRSNAELNRAEREWLDEFGKEFVVSTDFDFLVENYIRPGEGDIYYTATEIIRTMSAENAVPRKEKGRPFSLFDSRNHSRRNLFSRALQAAGYELRTRRVEDGKLKKCYNISLYSDDGDRVR